MATYPVKNLFRREGFFQSCLLIIRTYSIHINTTGFKLNQFTNVEAYHMRLKKNIATSETGFIFHPGTGDSFSANPIAAEILLHLKEGIAMSDIKKAILEKYDVAPNTLEKDWDDFHAQLREANLLDL